MATLGRLACLHALSLLSEPLLLLLDRSLLLLPRDLPPTSQAQPPRLWRGREGGRDPLGRAAARQQPVLVAASAPTPPPKDRRAERRTFLASA